MVVSKIGGPQYSISLYDDHKSGMHCSVHVARFCKVNATGAVRSWTLEIIVVVTA
jgi:hypothetical protein